MPKDTFHRLPEDKKLRIYHSAIQEFSARRFSDASLNQIVKTAKIPWGSFYQYFTGKEDLFLYMLGEIAKEKREVIGLSEGIEENADVFELCLRTTMATFEWSVNCAEYSRISMLMEIDNCDFVMGLCYNFGQFGKIEGTHRRILKCQTIEEDTMKNSRGGPYD
jgi:AcrR family transcriptional regulator